MLTTAIILLISILLLAQSEPRQAKVVVVDVCDVMTPRVTIKCKGKDCQDPDSLERIAMMNDHLNKWMAFYGISAMDLDNEIVSQWRREFNDYFELLERDKRRDRNLLSFFNH